MKSLYGKGFDRIRPSFGHPSADKSSILLPTHRDRLGNKRSPSFPSSKYIKILKHNTWFTDVLIENWDSWQFSECWKDLSGNVSSSALLTDSTLKSGRRNSTLSSVCSPCKYNLVYLSKHCAEISEHNNNNHYTGLLSLLWRSSLVTSASSVLLLVSCLIHSQENDL